MKRQILACIFFLAPLTPTIAAEQSPSSYAGQESRDIKAMSPEDVSAYLSGKGMGLAKAAELNNYAGPAHVLQFATPLALTPEQRTRTQTLFASMESQAITLGRALIDEERNLDRLFATKSVTKELLEKSLNQIAAIQAKLRAVHLEAHLAQVEILTPQQNARYAQLRGYSSGEPTGHGGHHMH